MIGLDLVKSRIGGAGIHPSDLSFQLAAGVRSIRKRQFAGRRAILCPSDGNKAGKDVAERKVCLYTEKFRKNAGSFRQGPPGRMHGSKCWCCEFGLGQLCSLDPVDRM
jgi:hypothetical protein